MDQFKPLVKEEYEIEPHNKSKTVGFLDFLDYQDFESRNKKYDFFVEILRQKCEDIRRDVDRGNQVCIDREIWV